MNKAQAATKTRHLRQNNLPTRQPSSLAIEPQDKAEARIEADFTPTTERGREEAASRGLLLPMLANAEPGPVCKDAAEFKYPIQGVQCQGFAFLSTAKSAKECELLCCKEVYPDTGVHRCQSWVWSNGPGGGCWKGDESCVGQPSGAWVGSSRLPVNPSPGQPSWQTNTTTGKTYTNTHYTK